MNTDIVKRSNIFWVNPDKAQALALRLARAEEELQTHASSQIDAIVHPRGGIYLLRPAQELLRQSEAQSLAILDSIADAIAVLNDVGEVCYQNFAVTRVLGYGAGALLGRSFFEYVHPDDFSAFDKAFSKVIEEMLPETTVKFRYQMPPGGWCQVEAVISLLHQSTETTRVVVSCNDVTHRNEVEGESIKREAELTQTLSSKGQLIAMISHELRTPLTPALLGVQTLEEDPRFADAKTTLEIIRRNIELQSRLLDELQDYTHVRQGKLRINLESLESHAVVRNVLEICHSDIEARQIDVRLNLSAKESHVYAGSSELQQILWNLVRNAVKFSERGGVLSINSVNDSPGTTTLEFVDNGIGIEPELLPLVFDSFQQGDNSMQSLYGGLGLGMFIARGLAEAQQGTLTVASEGRGKGTKFRLTLKTAPPAQVSILPPVPPFAGSLRILLVDDHDDTRAVLDRLLTRCGYTVFGAHNIATAVAIAKQRPLDILISDIGLPDGTGYDLIGQLRLNQPCLVGIALSGFGMLSNMEKSQAAGFSIHLVKPVNLGNLYSAIHTAALQLGEPLTTAAI